MNFSLHIRRQALLESVGNLEMYSVRDISPDMSFLEVLDVLNEHLTIEGQDPIASDSDGREEFCGACGVTIDGVAHGLELATATCRLYMRSFRDGDEILVEPWRARASR